MGLFFIYLGNSFYNLPWKLKQIASARINHLFGLINPINWQYNEKSEHFKTAVAVLNGSDLDGAADRTWTGTVLPPRDFKSLVSANSTTATKA